MSTNVQSSLSTECKNALDIAREAFRMADANHDIALEVITGESAWKLDRAAQSQAWGELTMAERHLRIARADYQIAQARYDAALNL